jgi:hypothetical protein
MIALCLYKQQKIIIIINGYFIQGKIYASETSFPFQRFLWGTICHFVVLEDLFVPLIIWVYYVICHDMIFILIKLLYV